MERKNASQGRFVPNKDWSEFEIARPLPSNAVIQMHGNVEVYKLKPATLEGLAKRAHEEKLADQDAFYQAHPELSGERAYYSWLAQASDY